MGRRVVFCDSASINVNAQAQATMENCWADIVEKKDDATSTVVEPQSPTLSPRDATAPALSPRDATAPALSPKKIEEAEDTDTEDAAKSQMVIQVSTLQLHGENTPVIDLVNPEIYPVLKKELHSILNCFQIMDRSNNSLYISNDFKDPRFNKLSEYIDSIKSQVLSFHSLRKSIGQLNNPVSKDCKTQFALLSMYLHTIVNRLDNVIDSCPV